MEKIRKSKLARIEKAYFQWLCDQINRRGTSESQYHELAEDLHRVTFYSNIPNDDNRGIDGEKLRESFGRETNYQYEYLNGPPSVLEMLIALAFRMDFALSDPNTGNQVPKWFWIMVNNLGLEMFSCDDLDLDRKRRRNDEILRNLLERNYDRDGKGGLFPLRRANDDQRKVEIWYQMNQWINENHHV